MQAPRSNSTLTCLACGAPRITTAGVPCWLCGRDMPPATIDIVGQGRRQFTIGDKPGFVILGLFFVLMLMFAMVVIVEAPGFGIVLGLFALPCLFRTMYIAAKRSDTRNPLTAGQWLATLLGYLGVVVLVGLVAFIGFFLTCLAVCVIGEGF